MAFNTETLFNMMYHAANEDTQDGVYKLDLGEKGELDLKPKQLAKVISGSVQAFMHTVANGTESAPIQAFSGSSDLPELTSNVFDVTMQTENWDLGWQKAFKGIPLMKGQLKWEISDVKDNTEFKLTPEGAKCEIGSVEGSTVTIKIQKYSRGIGFTWEMMEGRELYKFVEKLVNMRNKLYKLWGDVHYGLLATAAATNPVAYQGAATDSVVSRDAATMNKGASTITSATKDSGYGDTAQAKTLLYVSPLLRDRVDAALKATRQEMILSGKDGTLTSPVSWPIEVVYTYNTAIPTNKGVMVLPGHKIQNSVYMQELALKKKEIESLNENTCFWSAFGAAIGDNDQTCEISFV